jgi:transposase
MASTNVRPRPIYRRSDGIASAQPSLIVTVDDRLEPDHFVRTLRGFVERVLGAQLRSRSNRAGGFPYDPVDMLCVWLYGFMRGILTTRPLEQACRYDVRFEYLCRSCRPDHSTLSRYRQWLGPDLDKYMLRVLTEAEEQGVLGRQTMAVDGTKIPARKSQWLRKVKEESEKAQAIEEEAQTMLTHGKYLVGYNVQAAADAKSSMIVGYVITNKAEDSSQMEDVLKAVKKQSGKLSKEVIADKGYDSSTNAVALKAAKVKAYLPRARKNAKPPFKRSRDGKMVCAAGHVASEGVWKGRNGRLYRQYTVSKCRTCPLKHSCPGKGPQRHLKVTMDDPGHLRLAANARCDEKAGKQLLRLRGPTIERPFAQIKHHFGLRRFGLTGMAKARIEFGIGALTHNIRTLIRLAMRCFGPILAGKRFFRLPRVSQQSFLPWRRTPQPN